MTKKYYLPYILYAGRMQFSDSCKIMFTSLSDWTEIYINDISGYAPRLKDDAKIVLNRSIIYNKLESLLYKIHDNYSSIYDYINSCAVSGYMEFDKEVIDCSELKEQIKLGKFNLQYVLDPSDKMRYPFPINIHNLKVDENLLKLVKREHKLNNLLNGK